MSTHTPPAPMNTATTNKRTTEAIMPPVNLPAILAAKLRDLAEVAGIDGGGNSIVSAIIGDLIENGTISDILIDLWEITDHATIAKLYAIESGKAEIIRFPECKPRPLHGPSPVKEERTHCLQIPVTNRELDAWGRAAKRDELTFTEWGREVVLNAARQPVKKMSRKEDPPPDGHLVCIRFTASEHSEISKIAEQSGLSLLAWAFQALNTAWSGNGGAL